MPPRQIAKGKQTEVESSSPRKSTIHHPNFHDIIFDNPEHERHYSSHVKRKITPTRYLCSNTLAQLGLSEELDRMFHVLCMLEFVHCEASKFRGISIGGILTQIAHHFGYDPATLNETPVSSKNKLDMNVLVQQGDQQEEDAQEQEHFVPPQEETTYTGAGSSSMTPDQWSWIQTETMISERSKHAKEHSKLVNGMLWMICM